jgi:small subunit ribosomal protein S8
MDSIGDMLTRIRNAQMARHQDVRVPFSGLRWRIAELLEKEGYIAQAKKQGWLKDRRVIEIELKYENGAPAITEIKRISKPGRRWYAGKSEMSSKRAGRRLMVSTSKGIMTDKNARKAGLGGEILFEIW